MARECGYVHDVHTHVMCVRMRRLNEVASFVLYVCLDGRSEALAPLTDLSFGEALIKYNYVRVQDERTLRY